MESARETVDTVVIGAGQAGVAMSEHLTALGVPHLVLERDRIAERWRTQRWDSLVANGPAWHDRFPNMEFTEVGPDEFPTKALENHPIASCVEYRSEGCILSTWMSLLSLYSP